jgi:hypothetical protein
MQQKPEVGSEPPETAESPLDAVRRNIAALGITEEDIKEAIKQVRDEARKTNNGTQIISNLFCVKPRS